MPVQMGPILVQLQEAMVSNQYSADTCTAGASTMTSALRGCSPVISVAITQREAREVAGMAWRRAWRPKSERAALAGPLLAPDSGGSQDSVGVVGLSITKSEGGKPTASDAWHSLRRQHHGSCAWPKCWWLATDLCSGPGLGSARDEGKLDCFDGSAHDLSRLLHLCVCEMSRRAVCIPHRMHMSMASTWTG
jgi:hypothetical protein